MPKTDVQGPWRIINGSTTQYEDAREEESIHSIGSSVGKVALTIKCAKSSATCPCLSTVVAAQCILGKRERDDKEVRLEDFSTVLRHGPALPIYDLLNMREGERGRGRERGDGGREREGERDGFKQVDFSKQNTLTHTHAHMH